MKKISVRLLDCAKLNSVINFDISRVCLEADDFLCGGGDKNAIRTAIEALKSRGVRFCCVLPDIFTSKAEKLIDSNLATLFEFFDGFMVQSLDEVFYLREKGCDPDRMMASEHLYVCNNEAVALLRDLGIKHFTHPLEITLRQGYDVRYGDVETVIYGRAPLMVSAGCVRKNTLGCDGKRQNLILKDRKKMGFYVQNRCEYCYNVIYNSVPTMLIDEQDALHSDCSSVRLDFTVESDEEIARILQLNEACQKGALPGAKEFGFTYTRGHYHKGFTL